MIQEFIKKRHNLEKVFEEIKKDPCIQQETIEESGIEDTLKQLQEETFKMALVAPFSAGKSTFVNGLIGTDLLSMDVLAETAAITTLKYSETPRLEVFYYDGTKEVYDGLSYTKEDLKNILKSKTTVNRQNEDEVGTERKRMRVEETIRAVDVYWNLELCKDGVEIIDTPGLFARHKEHDDITAKVLPQANAILFLIEPDNVGERNFLNVITDYVQSAKRSSLHEDGRHIFFVINKIDKFSEEQLNKAKEELRTVLASVLEYPQIIEVSSYFAMKARMYENQELSLMDLKRDQFISFKDKDGFIVSGRQLMEEDVPTIKAVSQIEKVERAVSTFFEFQIKRFVKEAEESILTIYKREISNNEQVINFFKDHLNRDEQEYQQKLELFEMKFENLAKRLKEQITREINDYFEGNSSGGSHIEKALKQVKDDTIGEVVAKLEGETVNFWQQELAVLSEENSEEIVEGVFKKLILTLETQKKTVIQKSFISLNEEYTSFSNKLIQSLQNFETEVNKTFVNDLDLSRMNQQTSFFNLDEILIKINKDVEKLFEETSLNVPSKLKEQIEKIKNQHILYENAPGLFNAIRGIFGKAKLQRYFDILSFKEELNEMFEEVLDNACEELRNDGNVISMEISKNLRKVNQSFEKELVKKIHYYEAWRKRSSTQIVNEMKKKKNNTSQSIKEQEAMIIELKGRMKRVETQLKNRKKDLVHAFQ
ncbi:dynamin family protein [Priestia aryabhattai]|uniref:dynamin family protein n=1 Tax=Priestia aryabhattai TaxID=412384 RepID=UPI00211B95A1|nr:dynamin family protein [Priestia aryabhattai]MCQ9281103.1 dynamin family protein [Priestia aryabhattai]